VTMELYQAATALALEGALEGVILAKIFVPRDVHIVISSPWQSSQTRSVSVTKEKAFKISQKTIKELMKNEEAQFIVEAKANPLLFGDDFMLFESKTMSATLNGYPIEDPVGKSAKSIDLTIHLSAGPKSAFLLFTSIIQKVIPHATTAFHSSVFAYFAELRDLFPEVKSFLVIEVSEMLSEVTIVESSALSQSVSFPAGLHLQTEMISKELGKPEKEASMYLRMHREGTLEESMKDGVSEALKKTTSIWAQTFGQAIASLSKEVIVPDAIFLVSSNGATDWINEAIKSKVLEDYSIASQSFTFLSITPEHFNDFIKTTGESGHDVPLELSALYISTKF